MPIVSMANVRTSKRMAISAVIAHKVEVPIAGHIITNNPFSFPPVWCIVDSPPMSIGGFFIFKVKTLILRKAAPTGNRGRLIDKHKAKKMSNIDETHNWVSAYYVKYENFMLENHNELFMKFYTNIHPPQYIGGCIGIMQGAKHSDEDYAEIMRITKEFCEQHSHPFGDPLLH